MTPIRASIAGAIASIILILVVVELVRGRRLKERYALLWLVTGVVLLVLSLWREGLNTIAGWLGVTSYPPAVLFAVATLFIFLVLLHSGKDAGLSGAFGIGGGGSSIGGGSMVERNLDRATVFFAVIFVLNTFVLLKI